MSFWSRLKFIFRSKASAKLDKAEDPRETLDYSYQRQLELLQEMRRGIAEVATARKRLEMQAQTLQRSDAKLEALARRAAIKTELSGLQEQHEQLKAQEDKLIESSKLVETRIQQFRTRKET